MKNFAWAPARSIAEAAAAAATLVADAMIAPGEAGDSIVKAGGVDVVDLMKEGLLAPALVVSLRETPGLDAIEAGADGSLRIGAMVTLARLADDAGAHKNFPALTDAAAGSASPQIRNVATLGGNLLQRPRCWYFRSADFHCLRKGGGHCFAMTGENRYHAIFDNTLCAIVHPSSAATALVALGASIELVNAEGGKREVRLEDFFVSPDRDVQRENDLWPHEILVAVKLPSLPSSARMAHVKIAEKASFDWPLADVAALLDFGPDGRCASASIVLGAAAPTPRRAKSAESVLVGQRIDEGVAAAAGRAAIDGATPLAGNAYKLPLFATAVRRAILKAVATG
ncbi:MAG: FAD binding domain-containing protein [Roseiarcus sp.]|jgi:xanthine dehydrogenase YagS FAD-binding subunit